MLGENEPRTGENQFCPPNFDKGFITRIPSRLPAPRLPPYGKCWGCLSPQHWLSSCPYRSINRPFNQRSASLGFSNNRLPDFNRASWDFSTSTKQRGKLPLDRDVADRKQRRQDNNEEGELSDAELLQVVQMHEKEQEGNEQAGSTDFESSNSLEFDSRRLPSQNQTGNDIVLSNEPYLSSPAFVLRDVKPGLMFFCLNCEANTHRFRDCIIPFKPPDTTKHLLKKLYGTGLEEEEGVGSEDDNNYHNVVLFQSDISNYLARLPVTIHLSSA